MCGGIMTSHLTPMGHIRRANSVTRRSKASIYCAMTPLGIRPLHLDPTQMEERRKRGRENETVKGH